MAAAAAQAEACEILCRHGANIHHRKKDGSTPLHCVGSGLNHVQGDDLINTIIVLLQYGAKFSDRDKANKSAVTVLANRFPNEFVYMMDKLRDTHPDLIPVVRVTKHALAMPWLIKTLNMPMSIGAIQRDVDGLTLSRDEWRMVLNRLPIQGCKVFLLGDGGSGKSSLSAALRSMRKPSDPDETEDDPTNPMTRTYGMEYELFGIRVGDDAPDMFCIQDPGGHYQPHLVHPMLFQTAYGIYIIVVRVDTHTHREVIEQVSHWFKFVQACARPGGHVMIVFSGWSRATYIEDKVDAARAAIDAVPNRRKDLVVEEHIWYMDCRKSQSEEMGRLRAHLAQLSRSLQAVSHDTTTLSGMLLPDETRLTPLLLVAHAEVQIHDAIRVWGGRRVRRN